MILTAQTHHHMKAGALQIPSVSRVGMSECCFRLNGSPEGICSAQYHLNRGTEAVNDNTTEGMSQPTRSMSLCQVRTQFARKTLNKTPLGIQELLCLTINKLTSYANKQIRKNLCFFLQGNKSTCFNSLWLF